MGRFLAASIPTQLFIKRRGESFNNLDLIKDKEKILNQINKYIDLSFYDINEEEKQIYLKLNEEKANKCLKEFFKEIESILDLNHYLQFSLFKEEDTNEGFDLKNILKKNETKKEINFDNIVIKKDIKENDINYYMTAGEKNHEINEDLSCIDGAPWLFDLIKELRSIGAQIYSIHIWLDYDKFCGEDENKMLQLLNKFSKSYFKSELAKIMIFNIYG